MKYKPNKQSSLFSVNRPHQSRTHHIYIKSKKQKLNGKQIKSYKCSAILDGANKKGGRDKYPGAWRSAGGPGGFVVRVRLGLKTLKVVRGFNSPRKV